MSSPNFDKVFGHNIDTSCLNLFPEVWLGRQKKNDLRVKSCSVGFELKGRFVGSAFTTTELKSDKNVVDKTGEKLKWVHTCYLGRSYFSPQHPKVKNKTFLNT